MASKRSKTRPFGSITRQQRKDGTTIYRARFACRPCQQEADALHEQQSAIAEAVGQPAPAKPRVVHFGSWSPSHDEQASWLEMMQDEQRALDRDWMRSGGPQRCAWREARRDGDQTVGEVEQWGKPLSFYADRYLARTTGADSTRAAEKRLYEEDRTTRTGTELGIKDRWGSTPVRLIDRASIRDWMRLLAQEPGRKPGTTLSASQIRQRFFTLRGILKTALDDDALETDPSRDVTPPALPTGQALAAPDRWLPTEAEMQKIVYSMLEPQALAAAVAFGAGLRVGEVTALEVRDLRRQGEQQWTVSITKSESQNKGRSRTSTKTGQAGHGVRAVPEWVGALIEDYLTARDLEPADRLFPPLRGDAPSMSHTALRKDLARVCKELGFPVIGPQDLRAAGETHIALVTGSRARAAVWARHGVEVSAKHYVREDAERQSIEAAGWE